MSTARQPCAASEAARARRHRRQIEQLQLQRRGACGDGGEEGAVAAADIEQAAMAAERIGVEHVLRR